MLTINKDYDLDFDIILDQAFEDIIKIAAVCVGDGCFDLAILLRGALVLSSCKLLCECCRLQPLCLCSHGAECEHTPELWPSVHLSTEALNHPDPGSAVRSSETTQSTQDVHSPFVNTHSAISLANREHRGRAMCQHILCMNVYTYPSLHAGRPLQKKIHFGEYLHLVDATKCPTMDNAFIACHLRLKKKFNLAK